MEEVPLRGELKALCCGLSPRSSLPEAARVLTCVQAREIDADLPGALRTLRPAPLHDARVAGRRLRAGVTLFQCMYPGTWERAAAMAHQETRCLRLQRDLDTRCAKLRRLQRGLQDPKEAYGLTLARLLDESAAARRALANSPGPLAPGFMGPLLPALWRPRLSEALSSERFVRVRLKELAQRTAILIPAASYEPLAGVQHRLRIRGKALRYSLEMMEWRLGREATWRIKVLQKAQDALGQLHDIDVFMEYIGEKRKSCARDEPDCYREITGVLDGERRRCFGRFLDIRNELERACVPVVFTE